MIIVNFNKEKFKFRKGEFTDLDSWYEKQFNKIEEEYIIGEQTGQEYAELIQALDETYDEIFNSI